MALVGLPPLMNCRSLNSQLYVTLPPALVIVVTAPRWIRALRTIHPIPRPITSTITISPRTLKSQMATPGTRDGFSRHGGHLKKGRKNEGGGQRLRSYYFND